MAGNSATLHDGAGRNIDVRDSIVNVMSGNYGTASGTIGARPERIEEGTSSGTIIASPEQTKEDWFPSIIESLVPIWNGAVKDRVGADMLSCQLYRSPSLQDVIKIDESGWKFEMNNTVPYFDIGSLKKVTDEEPSGYIVTSKDELKIITDKLAGNLMGCIDISKDGKDSKVIVLLFQPGYPELFGFFFPDTKILTSFLGNLAAKQRSTTQELEAGPDTHHFASESSSTSDTAVTRSKRTVKDEPLSTSRSTGARLKRKVKKESLSTSDTAGARSKRAVKDEPLATSRSTGERLKRKAKKESSSTSDTTGAISKRTVKDGLIPWWIFTGDLQK